jgi:hypothetical protein
MSASDNEKLPYTFMVLEAADGTYSCNVVCRGFSTYEDAVSFVELWDQLVNDEKIYSYELH